MELVAGNRVLEAWFLGCGLQEGLQQDFLALIGCGLQEGLQQDFLALAFSSEYCPSLQVGAN